MFKIKSMYLKRINITYKLIITRIVTIKSNKLSLSLILFDLLVISVVKVLLL
jgi:hypothetical protein